jgi:spore coat protein U-like protein
VQYTIPNLDYEDNTTLVNVLDNSDTIQVNSGSTTVSISNGEAATGATRHVLTYSKAAYQSLILF